MKLNTVYKVADRGHELVRLRAKLTTRDDSYCLVITHAGSNVKWEDMSHPDKEVLIHSFNLNYLLLGEVNV